MDIVSRARNILTRPGTEWAVIDAEPSSVGDLYTKYLVPLGLIGPVASFIGLTVIGVSIPFLGTYRAPFLSGLTSAVVSFAAVLVGVYIWALIIDALAPTFSGQRSVVAALKVAVFAATPALLAGILSLLPALGMLQIVAAFYGLYLLYRGLPVLMKTPPDKAFGYTALTIVCGMVVGIILGVLMAALHFTPFFGHSPALGRASDDAVAQSVIAGAIGTAAGGNEDSKKAAESIAAGVVAAAKTAEVASKEAASTDNDNDSSAGASGGSAKSPASGTTTVDEKQAGAAAAAGIAALGALVGGGKAHVETVDFHALKAILPSAVGSLARSDATGEKTNAAGLAVSRAEGSYGGNGNGRLSLKITDMGNAGGIMAIGKLALATESESDSGYEKNVIIGGRKVHEKWTASGKSSELTSFVGDRFLVEVNASGVEMPTAEEAITAIDLDKLAALKG